MKVIFRLLTLFAVCLFCTIVHAAPFRTVVIDAGHGGHDNGGVWGKVYEKHLALDTAIRLSGYLKRMGYNVVMTRNNDYFLTLPQRVSMANSYRDAIFVSIHFNFTWRPEANGLETYYFSPEGQKLAWNVQSRLVRQTGALDRSAKFARFYVIRNSTLPAAILVEGGFVSNEQERERMKYAPFREALARGIAEGIRGYQKSF